MRVLLLSSVFPSRLRPTYGVFVRERARHVAAHCELVVVAPIPWFPLNRWIRGKGRAMAPYVEHQDGLVVYHPRVLSLPGFGKCLDGFLYFVSVLPFVIWLRRRFRFDLIDAHFGYPGGFAAALLGKVFRCPVLITIRGDEARIAGFALRRPQLRFALASARVIALSDSLRQLAGRLGIPADTVRLIPNGIDAARFHPSDRHAARVQLGLAQDRTILVAVGGLIKGKGHDRIVAMLPDLIVRYPNLLYVAVGNDGGREGQLGHIEHLVRQHRLQRHVRIAIARPHDEIPLWLAAADLFCLATHAEGSSNAILEALACGLPVVTTRVGGNPELVRHGEDGLLVPFWDAPAFRAAILRALERDWDRTAIATRAGARTWERTAAAVLEEFQLALEPCRLAKSPTRPIQPT